MRKHMIKNKQCIYQTEINDEFISSLKTSITSINEFSDGQEKLRL